MPDIVYIFNSPTSIGDLGFTVTHEKDDHVAYHHHETYESLRKKYAALKEVADGMEFNLRELAAYVGCWTYSTEYGQREVKFMPKDPRGLLCERAKKSLTAYQAHKEESDGV